MVLPRCVLPVDHQEAYDMRLLLVSQRSLHRQQSKKDARDKPADVTKPS